MRPHRAWIVLVYGILGFVVCPFLGIAAWTMGNADLREMAAGRMDPSGKDLTKAGRVCGMIATAILILQIFLVLIVIVVRSLSDLL